MVAITNNLYDNIREDFINKYPFLAFHRMYSDNDITKYELNPINRDLSIYIENYNNDNDIIWGTKYSVIYSRKEPENYQKIDCEIDFVSLKKNDNIGTIPRGYGGCVRLKFKDKVPDITKLLVQDNNENYNDIYNDILYLTTQEVMNKILEELEKA
ncbi:hypothetical protein [Chryseobacterium sp. WLY505]|uniref:hypothetical protein n=1 Tax=Chryseobacterium sp. WLY505 TaxID=3068892 RepID=UPI0027968C62|nr:hypothetical protein [Chryseobacterium sp. WLY505]MDQ1856705.1 hypothetical protein [Chryseobacterium sp. WLY505]